MDKIIQVVNAIISNKEKITNVCIGRHNSDEYYFIYDNKYKWSIFKNDNDVYQMYLYLDEDLSIEELSRFDDPDDLGPFIRYATDELKTREAKESFYELYQIVSDKIYGIDEIFDSIIKDANL